MCVMPKISIIIPVYNGSSYLEEAINSCLQQTYTNYEIIVVNDGSNDNGLTRKVALRYIDKIRYFEKANGGCASALNFGIEKMEGEYFAWLSHDDIFCRNKLKDQIESIMATGDKHTIALSNYYLANNNLDEKQNTNFHKYYSYHMIINSIFILLWGEFHFSGLLFNKSHFKRVGKFDENLKTAQDNDFIFRLLRNQKIVFTETPVSVVRIHNASGTTCYKDVVNKENCCVYRNSLSALSELELKNLAPNKYAVFSKIGGILLGMGDKHSAEKIHEKLSLEKKLYVCNEENFNWLKNNKIIIFGSGQYGLRIKYELEEHGLKPSCFIDNSEEKNNTTIDGIPCFLPEVIKRFKKSVIIVALKYHISAEKQLKDMGINNYMLKDEVDAMLLRGDYV